VIDTNWSLRVGNDRPKGVQELVADVGPGRVGIIFGIEVSRLERKNTDWYRCSTCVR
jgi:DNA invertase Pin-like site-specific DNA recombinase